MKLQIKQSTQPAGSAKIISFSESSTIALGRHIGHLLQSGDIISLDGDLGAGKTVLVRGIAAALGCKKRIVSPTFTLLMEHETDNDLLLCHFDVYRLTGSDDFIAAGLDEYLGRSDTICVIEWGDIIADILPPGTINIKLTAVNPQKPDERQINLIWPQKVEKLQEAVRMEMKKIDSGG